MDNARLDITGEGVSNLRLALSLAFVHHRRATHWAVIENTLVFFWAKPGDQCMIEGMTQQTGADVPAGEVRYKRSARTVGFVAESFIVPVDAERAAANAQDWLTLNGGADYGTEPDHDGDNGKGWRVFNESWGHVFGMYQAVCAVRPAWAMYGK